MKLPEFFKSQKGIVPIPLLLFAIVGAIAFLFVSSNAPLSESLFGSLYPKDHSHASAALPSDLNNDGKVNVLDLSVILANWNLTGVNVADLNNDQKVNVLDLSVVLANWNKTAPVNSNSMAMGRWTPNPKYDTCPNSADTARIKEIHDNYKVLGPDGKWYPTWHPPVDSATSCKFGHEHGDNPTKYPQYAKVKEHFAYNGDVTTAGIPFGYVAETLTDYWSANGQSSLMRHEDHVGHKVVIDVDLTVRVTPPGGAVGGTDGVDSSLKCSHLTKVHQGVHSKDAFQNNLHEIYHFGSCNDGQDIRLTKMGAFGKAGELGIVNVCGSRFYNDPFLTGLTYSSSGYPGTRQDGTRAMIDRQCILDAFLVPDGKWSGISYETWTTNMDIYAKDGKRLTWGIDFLFDVLDSIRYYNSSKPDNLDYMVNTLYETEANGDRWRGGAFDEGTNYGQIRDLTWDDPRSPFKGLHRGNYFKPANVANAAGPEVWYTDPFGKNGQAIPFPGSIKQFIEKKDVDYSQKLNGTVEPSVIVRKHDDGGKTVHAPN